MPVSRWENSHGSIVFSLLGFGSLYVDLLEFSNSDRFRARTGFRFLPVPFDFRGKVNWLSGENEGAVLLCVPNAVQRGGESSLAAPMRAWVL